MTGCVCTGFICFWAGDISFCPCCCCCCPPGGLTWRNSRRGGCPRGCVGGCATFGRGGAGCTAFGGVAGLTAAGGGGGTTHWPLRTFFGGGQFCATTMSEPGAATVGVGRINRPGAKIPVSSTYLSFIM